MGLLSLLTSPVTGPARGGWWVLGQVVGAAEVELYDETRIVAELRALATEVDAGNLGEDEHAAAEQRLLERLMEARARRDDRNEQAW